MAPDVESIHSCKLQTPVEISKHVVCPGPANGGPVAYSTLKVPFEFYLERTVVAKLDRAASLLPIFL